MIKKSRKKIYKSKDYNNPYFQSRKKSININFSWNWKSKLVLLTVFILIAFSLYGIFYSPVLKINHININGNNRVGENDLLDIAWQQVRANKFFIFPQNNLILLNKNDLAEAFEKKFSFENIDINKNFPDTLDIKVQEKSYAFVWVENETYYYSDIEGYIIKEISPLDIKEKKYPIIENDTNSKIANKKIEISPDLFYFVINAYNKLSPREEEYKIDRFLLTEENTIKLKLVGGPEIFFNFNNDLDSQLSKLQILNKEKLKNDFYNKEYIDLRFGDRVYYR